MLSGYHSDLIRMASQAANQLPLPIAASGVIVPGSYDQTTGMVSVLFGSTYGLLNENFEGPVVIDNVRLGTGHIGTIGGPLGNERVALHPMEGGFVAQLLHDQDDAPGCPAGEWWATLRVADQSPKDATTWIRIQGDDGNGNAGGTIRINAQTKYVNLAPLISLGQETPNQAQDGVVCEQHLQTAINNVTQAFQTALRDLAQQVQSGSGVPAPTIEQVDATASSVVFAANNNSQGGS